MNSNIPTHYRKLHDGRMVFIMGCISSYRAIYEFGIQVSKGFSEVKYSSGYMCNGEKEPFDRNTCGKTIDELLLEGD